MKNFLSILFVILINLNASIAQIDIVGRIEAMDKHMRRLNLSDIHFSNPGDIVKVDTVINKYTPESEESLIERLLNKVNETAHEMVNSNPQNVSEWQKAVINLPDPIIRNQSKIRKG